MTASNPPITYTPPGTGRDDRGRILVAAMEERQLLEESVLLLRALTDVLSALGQNPMLAGMIPKL